MYSVYNLRPKMKQLREEGMTLQEIADTLGMHRSSVRRNLIEMDVSTQNRKWKR